MRTIKFRGKQTNESEFIHGSYYSQKVRDKFSDEDSILFEKHFIRTLDDSMLFEKVFLALDVIPETLGQFTGLHDKNGKEIYEGDIINGGKLNENCIVEFDDKCGRFIASSDKYKVLGHRLNRFELIGNIHENKELLK